jgi:hypothetical protein
MNGYDHIPSSETFFNHGDFRVADGSAAVNLADPRFADASGPVASLQTNR